MSPNLEDFLENNIEKVFGTLSEVNNLKEMGDEGEVWFGEEAMYRIGFPVFFLISKIS